MHTCISSQRLKDPDIHVLDGRMPATKTHPPYTFMKTECGYVYGWIKKTITYANNSQNRVNPRDIAGNAGKKNSCALSIIQFTDTNFSLS